MLTICHGGCIGQPPPKAAVCTAFLEPYNFTLLPKIPYSNGRPFSKPASFMLKRMGGRLRFVNQHPRVQNLNKEIEAVDEEFQFDEELDGPRKRFRERGEEKDYDKDPEVAEILGTCLDDPDKARSKMEERLRKKRNRILQTKTGSGVPMNVTFNKFDYSNSFIWFEFYNPLLQKDVSLICDMIRSWHIIGRLGGCNSLNMQLSQSPSDKRPSYDAIQGANVEPATFYNIGDLEIQDNLARIWIDIGTSEPLLLDVLLNGLTQISSDFVGIKQVVFGGSEFENWKENLTTEDEGFSVHKI